MIAEKARRGVVASSGLFEGDVAMKLMHASVLAVVGILAVACGGAKDGGEAAATAPAAPAVVEPAAEPSPEPAAEPAASVASTGVPACDEYLTKYTACIDEHVPEAMRATFHQSMEQSRGAWAQAQATTPEAQQALADSCRLALDSAKQAMTAYGCTW